MKPSLFQNYLGNKYFYFFERSRGGYGVLVMHMYDKKNSKGEFFYSPFIFYPEIDFPENIKNVGEVINYFMRNFK